VTNTSDVYFDPYMVEINADPYPVFRRLREEAPLYYNDKYDFYALSRFEDVERGLVDNKTYISGRGAIIELIKSDIQIPPGVLLFEDPPIHTVHRGLLSRVFTPRKMNALEPKVREFCARCLDPLVGARGFDFVRDLGAQMPMWVIGMLLGIPEEDQEAIRDDSVANLRTRPGQPMKYSQERFVTGEAFAEYIDWRAEHPSDDLMTELLHAEFEDETGTIRRLRRDEVLTYVNVIAGAGNETTTRLIGWTGKTLSDHPDQRAEIVKNPGLIPTAIEELLRYEPPGPSVARYVTKDVEIQGQTVPAGSAILMLVASANRDEQRYPDGEQFNVRREGPQHITFGRGIHACLGSALARVEGRVALDELLKRFPEWTVDLDNAKLSSTSTVRGWDNLPAYTSESGRKASKTATAPNVEAAPAAVVAAAPVAAAAPGTETWDLTLATPMGPQSMTAKIIRDGSKFTGNIAAEAGSEDINGEIAGNAMSWTMNLTKPVSIKLKFDAVVSGDAMTGTVKLGMFGKAALTGKRVA
jgi:cytochrome P450